MSAVRRLAIRVGGLSAAWLLTPALLAADDSKVLFPGGAAPAASPGDGGGTANLVTLAVAVALAIAGGWLMWRKHRAGPGRRETHSLAIHETRSLGNRQYLVVAAYEGKKFLLGVCPGRIDLLAPLTERRAPEQPAP